MINPENLPYFDPDSQRKVAIVTGGNSGIGWYTVLHLYLHGITVYVAGRNSSKCHKAIKEIKEEAQRRKGEHKVGELLFLHMDLLDLKSVERAACEFVSQETRLDILINNAGIMGIPYEISRDGFEIQLQTNYVSHFMFTMLLLPVLGRGSRVVNLSSIGHFLDFWTLDLSKKCNFRPNMVSTWCRYAMAKTASIQFTKLLAIKQPELTCVSVHPGFVANTNLFSYWTRLPIVGVLFWLVFQTISFLCGVSNEEGSYATLKVALSEGISQADSGKYYSTGGYEARSSIVAQNIDNAATTWIWTVKNLRDRGFEV